MGSAADYLNVLRSYLGTHEEPPHSNRTVIGEKFGWNGVAWCAETETVCLHEAGVDFDGSASCSVLVGRYKSGENGEWLGNPGAANVPPGAEGFLGAGGGEHTFSLEWADVANDIAHCIDGNWGDAVTRTTRPFGSIYGWGLPKFDGAAAPGLPPPSATGGRPWLRLGSTGQWVSNLQLVLHNGGWLAGAVDGDFGPQTEAAVKAYQQARALDADGIVGPATWASIDQLIAYVTALSAPPPPPQVQNVPAFPGTTKLGSHGQAVIKVQYVLISRGWNLGPSGADGIFGQRTDQVVRQFQAEKGLTADGIVGPQTWVSLVTSPVT